jgi:chemotaxis protein MotB
LARKKRHAAHGHGWFVTFADLMALLMSFFVMVAAYSTQDQKKLQLVAGSMRDAFGVARESRFAGIIEQDGLPTRTRLKSPQQTSPENASDQTRPFDTDAMVDGLANAQHRGMTLAVATLRQAGHAGDRGHLEADHYRGDQGRRERLAGRPGRTLDVPGRLHPALRTHPSRA